jgi:hypothetical protein
LNSLALFDDAVFALHLPVSNRLRDEVEMMMKAGAVLFEAAYNLGELVEAVVALRFLVFDCLHCSRCSNYFYDDDDACHEGLCERDHHRDSPTDLYSKNHGN